MLKLDLNPPRKTLIQFGWIALFGFGLFAGLARWKWGAADWLFYSLLGLGLVMAACAALGMTRAIRPVFIAMVMLAIPIGFVVTHVLLAAIYYVLFTPVAVFFRLTGRDPLHRAWDANAKSYWNVRQRQRSPASYFRLY